MFYMYQLISTLCVLNTSRPNLFIKQFSWSFGDIITGIISRSFYPEPARRQLGTCVYQGLSGLVTAALCWPAFLIIEGDWSSPVPIEMPVRLSAALS